MTILVLLRDVSIGAAITAALILLLIFGKLLTAKAKYYLWLLLALRLLLPVTPGSSISLMNYVPRSGVLLESVETPEEHDTALSQAITPTEDREQTSEEAMPAAISSLEAEPIAEATVRTWDWADVLLLVWIVGAAVLLSVYIILYILTERRMTALPVCEDEETHRVFLHLKQKLRVSDRIKLVSGEAGMLGGLLRPTLVIPVERRGEDAAPIMVHELIHYKYADLWLYLLFRLLTAIYWFHPAVWICFWIARQDSEKACDERVLESGLVPAYTYAETLYQEGRLHSGMSPMPRTTFGGGHGLKGRMKGIARYRKRGKWVVAVAVVLALVITACGVTSVAKQESGRDVQASNTQNTQVSAETTSPSDVIGARIHALQPEYGRFGLSYDAHVAAGLIDPAVTEKNIISSICTEYTTTLERDGEELEAVFVFSCTQFTQDTTERQVLTELFVDLPRDVKDEQAWIDQQMERKGELYARDALGRYYTPDTVGPNLTREQLEYVAQRAYESGAVNSIEDGYDYANNWMLSVVSYRADLRQQYFNGTGIALYETRFDAFPVEEAATVFDPYELEDDQITFRNTAWGMSVEDVFSVEKLDREAWRYSADGKLIRPMPKTTPVSDHPEVTDINYCFNWTGPELRYGLNLTIVRYDSSQIDYESLINARTQVLGAPGYSDEDKTVWETENGYTLMLLRDQNEMTERLTNVKTPYVSNAGETLDVEAYMADLQPPNGHFGWTYEQHVEAGLLEKGLRQEPTEDGYAITDTVNLGGYDVEISYLFGPTLASEEMVLRQAFVSVPKNVVVRDWVESFWDPWKDKLLENSSLRFTSPVTLNLLLPEETQQEIIDTINERQDRTDATLNNWSLFWEGYMPESGLWQFNGTGAALYLTAEDYS